ncbi:DegT/DnrJ/EryC1/StrS family aminotransferase [Endothiovibrio diazotrophicus]
MNDVDDREFLAFARPSIGEEEIEEVVRVLRSGWLTTGKVARSFEEAFAEKVGAKYAAAVNSATAGLHLSLEALGVGEGDKVVTTPYTFTATAEVVHYLGAEVVFVDVDSETCLMDLDRVAEIADQPGVRVVLPVHFAGQTVDMGALCSMAASSGWRVVEDAAHSFPATCGDRPVGSIGDATVFSFYVTKTITTGEGGMVTCDDPEVIRRIRTMRLHGVDRDIFDRYSSRRPSWYYEVVAPGFKYNMTDIAAAIGVHQLARADEFRRRRAAIAEAYSRELRGLPLRLPSTRADGDMHAWHLYVVQLELERLDIDRDRFIELMVEHRIGVSVHFIPLHLQTYWRQRYGFTPDSFPVATDVYHRAVSLPIYPAMDDGDVARVIEAVRDILEAHGR